nr:unnamed protein product [Callosobruchus analis]
MTAGILTSIRKRDLLKKKCIANRNNEIINQEYRTYRNTLTSLIKVTKNNYYINKLNTSQNNYKKTWNIINEISNGNNAEKKQINQISLDGTMILNPEEIASSFNKFFINIADELTSNIPHSTDSSIPRQKNIHSFYLQPSDCIEVENIISDLKVASSPGMTNRKDMIDDALLRPGRLEVQVEISLPDEDAPLVPKIILLSPKKASIVPDKASLVPERASLVPKRASLVPKRASLVPKKASLVPKRASLVPKRASLVPKRASLVPKRASLVPKRASLVPKRASLVPKRASLVPKRASLVPKRASLVLKRASLVPKRASLVPKRASLVPKRASLVPKRASLVPKRASLVLHTWDK